MAATRGSYHDQQDDSVEPHEPQQQQQQQQEQLSIGQPPRRIQSLPSPKSTALLTLPTTTTATSNAPTTLAARQAAAKLMGSILDDSTIGSTVVDNFYPFPEERHQSPETEKENYTNQTFNRPRDSTTTAVPVRFMDSVGTLLNENVSSSFVVEPQYLPSYHVTTTRSSSMIPHTYANGGRKPNRYYQLEGSSSTSNNKWGGFLSMRRTTTGRSKNIATQPIMATVDSSLIMPTDEEDNLIEDENWKEEEPVSSNKASDRRREFGLRRNQRRFLA
jgi:hypothetical protein